MIVKCIEGELQIDLQFLDTHRWLIIMLTKNTEYEITANMQAEFKNLTERSTG